MTEANNEGCRCAFCGAMVEDQKTMFVQGPQFDGKDLFVCENCIRQLNRLIPEEGVRKNVKQKSGGKKTLLVPSQIKEKLDEYVVGQNEAKKTLSVAVYNHYKRIESIKNSPVEIQKSNILLVGPTGSGKTYLAQTMARILDVPFAMASATSMTEAGYVGDDVEMVLTRLLDAADGDLERAQCGIVFIDEIDKIACRSDGGADSRDVSGTGVQQALLKIIEGTQADIPQTGSRKTSKVSSLSFNTEHVLFVFGGAFEGIESISGRNIRKNIIGFGRTNEEPKEASPVGASEIEAADIIKYGLIPEFVGRIPVITTLDALDESALINILTKPKNALVSQYQALVGMDGVSLEFSEDALKEIAQRALKKKLGARGLRSIMEKSMKNIMYEAPGYKKGTVIKITKDFIDGKDVSDRSAMNAERSG